MTTTRNSGDARTLAAARLESAERVVAATTAFHSAADRIDAAEAELAEARSLRNDAVGVLRSEGLQVLEICELTGLSASHVQTLHRQRTADAA